MAEEDNKTINVGDFSRIERDDRVLDVFTKETIDKGVELWEQWTETEVEIIRIHLPKGEHGVTRHVFARKDIEQALLGNTKMQLL